MRRNRPASRLISANDKEREGVKTILLATDGSPSARTATATAIELAQATEARLKVVTVWRVPVYSFGYVPVDWTPELIEAERIHAHDVLEAAVDAAGDAGVSVTGVLRQGDPAEEICEAAETHCADLVVIGAHGWGPLKRLVFGSVSTRVLHEAPCPVLVVRGVPTKAADELVATAEVES
jgi:nucleotide-binding universal stress UspA family protein